MAEAPFDLAQRFHDRVEFIAMGGLVPGAMSDAG